MKWPLAIALGGSALMACSLLFDPSRVLPIACPDGVTACLPRPNATASCEGAICRYSCLGEYLDVDGEPSNGCERLCNAPVPAGPTQLVAIAGLAPSELRWTWPQVTNHPGDYQLCLSSAPPDGGVGVQPNCRAVTANSCVGGQCSATTPGLPDFLRVYGWVRSLDECGRLSPEAQAPVAAASPISMRSLTGWTLDAQGASCALASVAGDIITLEATSSCSAVLLGADEGWGSATYDVDVRVGPTSIGLRAGLVLLANIQGHRLRVGSVNTQVDTFDQTNLTQRTAATSPDRLVASSVEGLKRNDWQHLRVVIAAEVVSVSVGPDADRAGEILRWPDPDRGAAPRTGRVGFSIEGTARAEFRNLVISTQAALPPRGPSSLSVGFGAAADAGLPPGVRARPSSVGGGACPRWPEGPGCDGGCRPVVDAGCARISLGGLNLTGLAFDVPVGLDVRFPWDLEYRYAPIDGGLSWMLVSNSHGAVVATQQYGVPPFVYGQATGVAIPAETWNTIRLRVDPDGGRFQATINGVHQPLANQQYPPPNVDRHPGRWSFFEVPLLIGVGEAYLSSVEVSQPPPAR